ncbi:MAG: MoxR family ATPase [Candidatus Pacebacteria bacterium]|nr:MoxR family ATPase [Candidatus Paceibacterota bacterium]
MESEATFLMRALRAAREEIGKVIIGQGEVIDQALVVILARQHALVEGVPGIAKTLLVRTLACVLGTEFARIQFTPDLMPADITGTNVFDMRASEFSLLKGPIFTSFLLADEINRAPAKTQAALLQAMQERDVTIDRQTYRLAEDFTVFATQNPIEYEGTYPLPEAQKDRFMMKIVMDYPSKEQETQLATRMLHRADTPESVLAAGVVKPVLQASEILRLREALENITVRDELVTYVVDIVHTTRTTPSLLVGAGPRATQALLLASRAYAAVQERDFVTPDDIKAMAVPVLEHRLVLRPEFEIEGVTAREVIENLLSEHPVPR